MQSDLEQFWTLEQVRKFTETTAELERMDRASTCALVTAKRSRFS